jgi:glycerol-3-phosphate dehydrogenase
VIGGGITGICTAWEAASRGLSVALIERNDFAHAASGNCFKMVHGGIRYLQHADVARIRQSSKERNAFLRIAPHLVRPIPIVIPTYGHGLKGRELLRLGALVYDASTVDRNRGVRDRRRRLPWAEALSREACLELFPGLPDHGLTSGVLFYDGQMHSPARLALAFLKSALAAGAQAANYARVAGFMLDAGRIRALRVVDELTGDEVEVRAKLCVNAAGGWLDQLLKPADLRPAESLAFSRDAALVIRRQLTGPYGLAILGSTSDPDALLSRGRRHLFIAPWRDRSLVGVWHAVHDQPDQTSLTAAEIEAYLDEVNAAYPALQLEPADVSACLTGMTLFGQNRPGARNLSYGKRSVLLDHQVEHGIDNLISAIGVRYTVARSIAEQAVNLTFRKLGRPAHASRTAVTPVYGGDIPDVSAHLLQAKARYGRLYGDRVVENLVQNHGTAYTEVLSLAEADPTLTERLEGSSTTRMEVVHAVRNEMAVRLADVVLRRTDLGSASRPGQAALVECGRIMAQTLQWDETRLVSELRATYSAFPAWAGDEPLWIGTGAAAGDRDHAVAAV